MNSSSSMVKFSQIDSVSYRFKTTYYLINICVLLAFVGIIIKIVFSSIKINDDQGPAFSTMVGYIFSTIALLGLLMGVVSYYFKVKDFPQCSSIYPSFFQIIALFLIFIAIIRQSVMYSKMINTNQVDPEYYKFSSYSSIF